MPRYTFKHKDTEEIKVVSVPVAERKAWMEQNPDWIRVFNSPEVNYRGTGEGGSMKNSKEFVETMQRAHNETPNSVLDQTSTVLRKHGTGE